MEAAFEAKLASDAASTRTAFEQQLANAEAMKLMFSEQFTQVQQRLTSVDEFSRWTRDEFENSRRITTEVREETVAVKEESTQQIQEMKYVSSEEQAQIMARFALLEEETARFADQLDEVPRMVAHALEENQIHMAEFRERTEGRLSDFKSQLAQAKFADDDIDELRQQLSKIQETTNDEFSRINESLTSLNRDMQRRREAEHEIAKFASTVNDLRSAHEVQLNMTNPAFTQMIKKQKRELQELRNIIEQKEAADEEAEAEDSLITLDVRAELEVIKLKLQNLEESRQSTQVSISTLTERLDDLGSHTSAMKQQVYQDMEKMRESIGETFVDLETFKGIRQEVETLRTATETNIQAAVEQRENTNEEIQQVRKLIEELKSGAIAPGTSETEVVGAGGRDSASGSEEIRNMKILINGIDLSQQRQMRKIKRSIRKLERAVEDVTEDKGRQQKVLEMERELQAAVTQAQEQPAAASINETVPIERQGETIQPALSQFRLPIFSSGLGLLQDDFQLFFVLMFTLLLYFLVADLFS
jgi:hypothetical protein